MIAKIQKVLRYLIFCAIGFGVVGAVLGLMHNSEDEWMWFIGFALIGAFSGAALALVTGRYKMLFKLILVGAAVGAISRYLISSAEIEQWLQMTILGALFGAFAGVVIALLDKGKKPAPVKTFECDECGRMVGKDDKFCPGCGTEFE
ncbi:MAG: zinc ribbon domain-containing protein [Dehalococcoidales bacterium]|jgi:hypothetical protein|nr:zinc ribbon domain-containing protein [Dehalococcoidales bacterium]MDD5402664.1 zinc ribbon domain-containing protein [Dehalococcoidales bacterium]